MLARGSPLLSPSTLQLRPSGLEQRTFFSALKWGVARSLVPFLEKKPCPAVVVWIRSCFAMVGLAVSPLGRRNLFL